MADAPTGIVILAYGPVPMDFIGRASKLAGEGAVLDQRAAQMAGATLAVGSPAALKSLSEQLEPGAMQQARRSAPAWMSEAAIRWLSSGQRGISSNTMFTVMTGVNALNRGGDGYPHDPDDLNRCLLLLAEVPELRPRLGMMRGQSKEWAALIDNWDRIEQSFMEEVGLGWTKGKSAPRTYSIMMEVLKGARNG